jgi:hypothetical protein
LALDTVRGQEMLAILKFELLILIKSDFSREVYIPVEVVDHYEQISLFLSIISFSKVDLV